MYFLLMLHKGCGWVATALLRSKTQTEGAARICSSHGGEMKQQDPQSSHAIELNISALKPVPCPPTFYWPMQVAWPSPQIMRA